MTVENPCLSGGAIEVFLEPAPPAPARARRRRHADRGARSRASAPSSGSRWSPSAATTLAPGRDDLALVVAAHGRDELHALRARLEAGVPVRRASSPARRRGDGVLGELRGDGVARGPARAHRRAGRDRHRRAHRRRDRALDPGQGRRGAPRRIGTDRPPHCRAAQPRPPLAVDPICGMTVAAVAGHALGRARRRDRLLLLRGLQGHVRGRPSMPRSPLTRARSSPGWCSAPAARSASAARSSCSPTATARCSGHVVGVARACGFDQTIVAIGGAADDVRAGVDLAGAEVVVNDAYGEGCSSSIAAALGAVDPRCEVLVLMLGDQPGVTAETVATLLAGRGDAPLAVCRYDDGRGHPIAFARERLRRPGRPPRRQGRLAAARPARRARWPRSRSPGPIPLDVDTAGGLPGRPRRAAPHEPRRSPARRPTRSPPRARRRDARPAPRGGRLPRRRGPGDVDVPEPAPAPAAAARGRGGRGQDRGGQVAGGRARHAADPAAVLRGDRRGRGAVRVELPAPAAQHPARRRRRLRRSARRSCSAPTT